MADLNSSRAGRAAETLAAATFLRAGFQVGLPYWDDDECDLLILHQDGNDLVTLPVQVKSVQGSDQTALEVPVAKLKKRYVERNPWLSLFLIAHSRDRMWFIPGSAKIIAAYDDWVSRGKTTGKGKKRTKFASLKPTANVPFRVFVGQDERADINERWRINPDTPSPMTKDIMELVRLVRESR